MADDSRKVVWVLGTGFSAPLGGPMLRELLSLGLHREVAIRYAEQGLGSDAMKDVIRLYHYGRQFPEGAENWLRMSASTRGERLWDDAEDFLDTLDTCTTHAGESLAERLRWILKQYDAGSGRDAPTMEALGHAARRHIAAACCSFLDRHSAAKARWRPYRRWAKDVVAPGDVIITFNYDCLLEALGGLNRFHVVTNFGPSASEDAKGLVRVYKLHGSTGWLGTRPGEGALTRTITVSKGETTAALTCKADQLVIATTGPGKNRAAKALKPWWIAACEALKEAAAIVFMGYRFPPNDSDARTELLDAIVENKVSQRLTLHTVLGPRQDDDTARLEQMLRYAMGVGNRVDADVHKMPGQRYSLRVHRLYAQDFMSLATRAQLVR